MPKSKLSESDSEENVLSEEAGPKNQQKKMSKYEMQRLKRIEDNKKRMEALGLHKMANSFMGSVQKTQKINNDGKGKKKVVDEDDEYNPAQDDEEISSSSEEDDESDDESSLSRERVKRNSATAKKRGPIQKPLLDLDFVDDDDALMQAIALSLQDSVSSPPPRSPGAHLTNTFSKTSTKRNSYIENESGKRKRRKPISSRVQMTEDEMLVHFFQFDETGKGGFTLGDVHRVATAHDFTWSEKEMADMICYFDSDGDGKINFDDLRKIVGKCNMLKGSDGAGTGKVDNCRSESSLSSRLP
ncbi:hypothetical protein OROMI_017636 [Orobanche minor]